MTAIARYEYYYNTGSMPDRRIKFLRTDPSNPRSLHAIVTAITRLGEHEISRINGSDINVEMMTTKDKVEAIKAERDGENAIRRPDRRISNFETVNDQDMILDRLEPKGNWRIEIINEIGDISSNPYFEKPVSLTLFNPSMVE